MTSISNAALAQRMNELVSRWDVRESQYREWISGAADGGPFGDGRYPLTSASGAVYYVKCPAALQAAVDGPAASVVQLAAASQDAAAAAATSASSASNAAATATAQRDLAVAEKTGAQFAKGQAEAAQAAAEAARNDAMNAATQASDDSAVAAQAAADTAADREAAETAAANAAASAAAAATFLPSSFYTKVESDGRFALTEHNHDAAYAAKSHTHAATDITSGTLSDARLPATMSAKTFSGAVTSTIGRFIAQAAASANAEYWFRDEAGVSQAAIYWNRTGDDLVIRRYADDGIAAQGELRLGASTFTYNGATLWHANNFNPANYIGLNASGLTQAGPADIGVVDASIKTGFYTFTQTNPGSPKTWGGSYHLFHSRRSTGGGEFQLAGYEGADGLFFRSRVTGAWSTWQQVAVVGHTHAAASTTADGFLSATDKAKLDGIAAGATANATNAQLRDRATHTGTQAASTITQDASNRFVSDAEKATWNSKQAALGYTPLSTAGGTVSGELGIQNSAAAGDGAALAITSTAKTGTAVTTYRLWNLLGPTFVSGLNVYAYPAAGTPVVRLTVNDAGGFGFYNDVGTQVVAFDRTGNVLTRTADASALVRHPRVFVRPTDPGPLADDGDVWLQI